MLFAMDAQAYKFVPSEIEYQSWSRECKAAYGASNSGQKSGFSKRSPELGEEFKALIWSVGAWHYCGGVIKIRRAELSTTPGERRRYFEQGISDAKYSYSSIDKVHPWAAEMATTLARGYRGLGQTTKAKKYLDEAMRYHSGYPGAYLVYAMLYFDENDYQSAKKILLRGNQAVKQQSSEIFYYLGLTSLKLGEIDEAKNYAAQAARLGHPLMGLRNKLKALEKASTQEK